MRAILTLVALVADTEKPFGDETHDGGGNALAREAGAPQIGGQPSADFRQVKSHVRDPAEFAVRTLLDRVRVIAVLLPPARIVAERLYRGGRTARDVHVAVGGRNAEGLDPRQHGAIMDGPARMRDVSKAGPRRALPQDPIRFTLVTHQSVVSQVGERIATITLNRPDKLNALNHVTLTELGEAMAEARSDPTVGGIILTGAGRAFAAGADISEIKGLSAIEAQATSDFGQRVFRSIETSPKPVIAAVNGFSLG